MKKFLKWFGFLAAAGTAAGVVAAYVLKTKNVSSAGKDQDSAEDEDYDLDADLKPAAEREYFSLNNSKPEATDTPEAEKTEKAEDPSSDEK